MSESTRHYGNLRRPSRPGLFGFTAVASAIGAVAAIFVILAIARFGPMGGAIAFALSGALIMPSRRRISDSSSAYERWFAKIATSIARKKGTDRLYQGGAASFTGDGQLRLPGLMASSEMVEHHDALGTPFGVIILPGKGHYTVVYECAATGQDLVDGSTIDFQVDHWAAFLKLMGDYADVDGVQAVIESAPDTGLRLQEAVLSKRAETSPGFAQQVINDVVGGYSRGESMIMTRVAITFSAKDFTTEAGSTFGKKKLLSQKEMLAEIGNRLPTITAHLRLTGAGSTAQPMRAADICDAVRVCVDPTVAPDVEKARREGGTGLSWSEVGPVRWVPYDDCVHHDLVWSKSWHMLRPPAGVFTSSTLEPILSPHPSIMRKRVALLYRPHDAETAQIQSERDVNTATFSESAQRRATARSRQDIAAAQQSAREVEQSAGLVSVGMMITITVASLGDLPKAEACFAQLRASSQLRVRPALGNQAVAWTATLPVGLVLPEHLLLPEAAREFM